MILQLYAVLESESHYKLGQHQDSRSGNLGLLDVVVFRSGVDLLLLLPDRC